MKRIIIASFVFLGVFIFVSSVSLLALGTGGRHHDRDWDITQLNVSAAAVRVTNTQSGMLFLENHGADAYIAFNATADATDIKIPDGGSVDFFPASIRIAEYFTVYSAGATSVNYVVLD